MAVTDEPPGRSSSASRPSRPRESRIWSRAADRPGDTIGRKACPGRDRPGICGSSAAARRGS